MNDQDLKTIQTMIRFVEYYKVMFLATMMEKHSPKKAKALRRRFEYLNPLRLLGLL